MVGVNAMKNIVMEQILVGRTLDIRAILPIFRNLPYLKDKNAIFDIEIW